MSWGRRGFMRVVCEWGEGLMGMSVWCGLRLL